MLYRWQRSVRYSTPCHHVPVEACPSSRVHHNTCSTTTSTSSGSQACITMILLIEPQGLPSDERLHVPLSLVLQALLSLPLP